MRLFPIAVVLLLVAGVSGFDLCEVCDCVSGAGIFCEDVDLSELKPSDLEGMGGQFPLLRLKGVNEMGLDVLSCSSLRGFKELDVDIQTGLCQYIKNLKCPAEIICSYIPPPESNSSGCSAIIGATDRDSLIVTFVRIAVGIFLLTPFIYVIYLVIRDLCVSRDGERGDYIVLLRGLRNCRIYTRERDD